MLIAGLQFSRFPLKTNRQTNKIKRKTEAPWKGSTKSSHGAFRFQKLVPKFPFDPLKSSKSETGHKVRHAQTHSPSLFTIFQFLYCVLFRWNTDWVAVYSVRGFVILEPTTLREWVLSTLMGQMRPFLPLFGACSKRSYIWIVRLGGQK